MQPNEKNPENVDSLSSLGCTAKQGKTFEDRKNKKRKYEQITIPSINSATIKTKVKNDP